MRKALVLLLLLAAFAFAADAGTDFQNKAAASNVEMAKNWPMLSVGALMLSIILVAIAYAVGIGFELPEIQAWAGNELVQVFTNAIIIVALIATITFIEIVVLGICIASNLDVPACQTPGTTGESCLQTTTLTYLNDYVETAKDKAKSALDNSVVAGAWMGRRLGITCSSIYCLQFGVTGTFAAQNVLNMDKYAIIFEYYMNLLSFMEAQRFFVQAISFNMAPVVLAIGIVMRSFFFSRKLGGLLMSIAIGIMFFFPGMYIFDWLTLDMATNGDKPYGNDESQCAPECGMAAPIALAQGSPNNLLNTSSNLYTAFPDNKEAAQALVKGTIDGMTATTTDPKDPSYGRYVISCNSGSIEFGGNTYYAKDCPMTCRELPFPAISDCVNRTAGTPYACAAVNPDCKLIRKVIDLDPTQMTSCPDACKAVPPLKSDCNNGNCLASSYDCRMARVTEAAAGFPWRPAKPTDSDQALQDQCALAHDCVASLDAYQSCVYVVGPTGKCDQEESDPENICKGCDSVCRIDSYATYATTAPEKIPANCKENNDPNGAYLPACVACHPGCKVREADITALAAAATADGKCASCDWQHRLIGSKMPPEYTAGPCSYTECPKDYRVLLPRNVCENCLFTEEPYIYNPPLQTKCTDLCKPPDNVPVSKPGTNIGADGLAGDSDIQDLSRLMVPAYALPLFNIVATLVFIKGLSTFLGGDIEIPGISKVF